MRLVHSMSFINDQVTIITTWMSIDYRGTIYSGFSNNSEANIHSGNSYRFKSLTMIWFVGISEKLQNAIFLNFVINRSFFFQDVLTLLTEQAPVFSEHDYTQLLSLQNRSTAGKTEEQLNVQLEQLKSILTERERGVSVVWI